jgi:predicted transcriptional regulator of viral defense system
MGPIQDQFLKILDENQWDVFSTEKLISDSPLSKKEVRQAIRHLADDGLIVPIEKGKYRRRHFTVENVIGCFMAADGGVAYWSALNAHGLTEQFPNKTFIQNSHRRGRKTVAGVGSPFQFVSVKPNKLVGYKTLGYGNHAYQMTDVEKTVIDCFDLPQYAGGYHEIIKAFNKASLSAQKMVAYCKAVNNIAVTKRLAYLVEMLEKPNMDYFIKYAKAVCNERYSPFDASLPHKGKYYRRWRLILNMSQDEILEIANPMH